MVAVFEDNVVLGWDAKARQFTGQIRKLSIRESRRFDRVSDVRTSNHRESSKQVLLPVQTQTEQHSTQSARFPTIEAHRHRAPQPSAA